MKTVLLTGGTGFVGANLARSVLAQGYDLHLLVRPGHQTWRIAEIAAHIQIHEVNLLDPAGLADLIARIRPDWVYHLATSGAYSWQNNVQQIIQTNINGTVNLLEACRKTGFDVFINTGSSSEYGLKDHAPSETEALDPNSEYAAAKGFATQYCRYLSISQQLKIVTLRLYSVFGPFEDPNRFIPTLLLAGMQGQYPPLVNPQTARDFIYVDDVTAVYRLVAEAQNLPPGAVFNLGTGIQTTIEEAVQAASELLGLADQPQWGSYPNRKWDTSIWVANIQNLGATLGWSPQFDFRAGLARTLTWFQNHPEYLAYYQNQKSGAV